ncbi:MAG: sugar ABC transporter permease [Litorilinea sp.]|nr:MAG: sugar ABC transporter permease [Litorilinea sp.]
MTYTVARQILRISRLKISQQRLIDNIDGWLFILPAVLGVLAFNFFPILLSLVASFTRWDAITRPEFIGLENYVTMFTRDTFFRITFRNTLFYVLGKIPFAVVLGLMLALLTNRRVLGINFFRTAYYTPVVTSTIAIGIVWTWILSGQFGVLNHFLARVGIDGPDWLADPAWAMIGVIIVSIWHDVGYPMVIYLAALQGIPEVLYEAAEIDGATYWQKTIHLTVPLISPATFFIVILQFISSFQIFGLIYIMTNGGPANSTNVYIYYLYQNAFAWWKMGYASALAWFLFLVIGAITLLQWKMQDRWVFYS